MVVNNVLKYGSKIEIIKNNENKSKTNENKSKTNEICSK